MRTWLVLVAIALAVPSLACADEKQNARDAYRRATLHYELGEFRKALEAFKDAYRSVPDPALLFDLAQCHRQLGDAAQAAREYRLYLLKFPGAPRRDELRALIERLERAAAEADAATADGSQPPRPTPPPPKPTPPLPTPPVPVERHATPRPPTWLVFTTGGVGVAALVAAIVLASQAQALSDGERAKDPLLRDVQTAGQTRLLSSSANGLFIGGGALLLATGVLALTANWHRHASSRPAAWLAPTGNGLAVAGRF